MARVHVFSTPGCAGCTRTKQLVVDVLAEYLDLDWEEIDLTEQPELAARYGIMSVPAIVIDGTLAFTAVPKPDALRTAIAAATTSRS
jgi:thioredoxin 1